ncbi:MAG: hypothetical protein QOF10_1490 [Kribbellaceae bacterium]|jgi:hypothetical protein|nr:hypothetical protein [Kribbellaceae bacterium]
MGNEAAMDAERGPESGLPIVDDFDELVALVERRPGMYLRYSAGLAADLESGHSRDHEAEVELPGWSVTTISPEPWWPRPVSDWAARRICQYAHLAEQPERFPWLLIGRLVGRGPDHEPLVVDMDPVIRIGDPALETALKIYHERFDVGDDSRRD